METSKMRTPRYLSLGMLLPVIVLAFFQYGSTEVIGSPRTLSSHVLLDGGRREQPVKVSNTAARPAQTSLRFSLGEAKGSEEGLLLDSDPFASGEPDAIAMGVGQVIGEGLTLQHPSGLSLQASFLFFEDDPISDLQLTEAGLRVDASIGYRTDDFEFSFGVEDALAEGMPDTFKASLGFSF